MKTKLAPNYYRTSIALIDDDEMFLNALSLSLAQSFSCKKFTNSTTALSYVNQCYQPITELAEGVFNKIANKKHDDTKHHELSVVVVDYDMPSINGIELCSQIKNSAVRKILLTGQASSHEVMTAFNQGVIHYYIDKKTCNLNDEIKKVVADMQRSYFRESLQSLSLVQDPLTRFFLDSTFATFFEELCHSMAVEEYYFNPATSRFSLSSAQGESTLIVLDDADIEAHITIIREEDGPESWIDALQSREYVPFFISSDGFYTPEKQGNVYPLVKAKQITGEKNFYCAVINQSSVAFDASAGTIH